MRKRATNQTKPNFTKPNPTKPNQNQTECKQNETKVFRTLVTITLQQQIQESTKGWFERGLVLANPLDEQSARRNCYAIVILLQCNSIAWPKHFVSCLSISNSFGRRFLPQCQCECQCVLNMY